MHYFSGQIILAVSNSDAEGAFWTQMLVLAILATAVGIYSLVKIRAKKFGGGRDSVGAAGSRWTQPRRQNKGLNELKTFSKAGQVKATTEEPLFGVDAGEMAKEKGRDLGSGMERLEVVFLVSIVEKTKGDDKNDVMMRRLSFNELVRRGQLKASDSNALKVYAMNDGNLYGKDIQSTAMKELAKRTGAGAGGPP